MVVSPWHICDQIPLIFRTQCLWSQSDSTSPLFWLRLTPCRNSLLQIIRRRASGPGEPTPRQPCIEHISIWSFASGNVTVPLVQLKSCWRCEESSIAAMPGSDAREGWCTCSKWNLQEKALGWNVVKPVQWISKGLAPEHQKKKNSHTAFWGTLGSNFQHFITTTHVFVSLIFCYQYDNYIELYSYKNFHDIIQCIYVSQHKCFFCILNSKYVNKFLITWFDIRIFHCKCIIAYNINISFYIVKIFVIILLNIIIILITKNQRYKNVCDCYEILKFWLQSVSKNRVRNFFFFDVLTSTFLKFIIISIC